MMRLDNSDGAQASPALDLAVQTVGLSKVYPGGTVAVDQLDLAVRRGELLGLLGPNGAGKSTTVGMLTTGVRPTRGGACVAGVDVVAQPALARQHLGVVPQRNTLDRSLNVRDNLVFHGRFFGMRAADARTAADALLGRVALANVAGKRVDELSGGMAQRLMIARAIMHRPPVLFLDEPTAGLDPQSRLAVHDIVGELNADGLTVVLITHDMREADQLSDRVAIIDRGRLLALDTPTALKRSVDADTVVTVIADADPATLAPLFRAGVPSVRGARPLGDALMLTVRGDQSVFAAITAAADRHRVVLREVRIDEPTLETVFIQLTGKELRES